MSYAGSRSLNCLHVVKLRSHCPAIIASSRSMKDTIMNNIGLVVVTAGAAFVALTPISYAQGTNPQSNDKSSGLCWDASTNMILPDYRSTLGSVPLPDPSSTGSITLPSDSSSTVGSALSSHPSNNSGSSSSTKEADLSRPAGIPDC